MKKFLLSAAAAVLSLGMYAETEVTFDFDKNATAIFGIDGRSSGSGATAVTDGDITTPASGTIDGVTVTVSASTTNTANRLWASAPVLRMYGGTLTVAAPDHYITKIVFKAGSKFDIEKVSAGQLDSKTWVADEGLDEVVFTIKSNTQINTVTVTLDGEIGDAPGPVVLEGTGEGTEAAPYDVTRALSILANGVETSANVYVTGTVSEITDPFNETYGNISYNIAQGDNTILVYRGKYWDGANFTSADDLKVGDVVVICGVLKNYNGTLEITNTKIITINGQGKPQAPAYTPVGDGTEENPYTVADIKGMNIKEADGEKYWVIGYILGSAASATSLNEAEKAVDSNIALAETFPATEFIPVALPVGEARTALGVATNPENIGKEVKVYGTLEKYFSVAGVKNVTDYAFTGKTGIENVIVNDRPAVIYNLQGQRVQNPTTGLYIINGKKVYLK